MGSNHKKRAVRNYKAGELAKLTGLHRNKITALGRKGVISRAAAGGYHVSDHQLDQLKQQAADNG